VLIPHHKRKGRVDGYVHYHFLGYVRPDAGYLPGVKGWYVFKVIRWLHDVKEVSTAIHYFLTHCSIVNGRHSITYFGQKFKKPKLKQKILDDWCPICEKYTARTVPIIDYNGCVEVQLWGGCSVEGGG